MAWHRILEYAAALLLATIAGCLYLLTRKMELIFDELGIRLPAITEGFLWRIAGVAPWWLVAALALAVTVAVIASLPGDEAGADGDGGSRGSPWAPIAAVASVALLIYGVLACFLPLLTTINKLEG